MIGFIYIIVAQFLWATEFIIIRRFFSHLNIFFVMALASVFGSLLFAPSLFLIKQKITPMEIVLIFIYGLTSWYLAQSFYAKGIQMSTNSFAAALITLSMPFFTLILSFIFLKETITPKIIAGGICMIVGFLLLSTK